MRNVLLWQQWAYPKYALEKERVICLCLSHNAQININTEWFQKHEKAVKLMSLRLVNIFLSAAVIPSGTSALYFVKHLINANLKYSKEIIRIFINCNYLWSKFMYLHDYWWNKRLKLSLWKNLNYKLAYNCWLGTNFCREISFNLVCNRYIQHIL